MKRIEQALARARGDGSQRTPARQGRPFSEGGPVRYTETRVLTPDAMILARNRVVTGSGRDAVTNSYKLLRTQVLHKLKQGGWNTVAVSSPNAGEGKTLTSVNLALSLAREVNHTVLLVDLDLRNPSIHRRFGHEPRAGIVDHLVEGVPLNEVLFNPGLERLVVIPGREPVSGSSELLSSPAMVNLVEELKTRYPTRLIVFDLPPLLTADDVLAFAPYVETVLLVAEEGRTPRASLERSARLLHGTPLLGCVLNRASEALTAAY